MDLKQTVKALENKGYKVTVFKTGEEAVTYLSEEIKGKTVGFGGSQTLTDLNLRITLAENNTVLMADFPAEGETHRSTQMKAVNSDIYLLSANAVSDEGEIINIDATGNRLAGSLFGHEKAYYIIGQNKIGGTLEEAVKRARNIAGPKNALRFHCQTPCAVAVMSKLEDKYKLMHKTEESIDQAEWQKFIEGLSVEELGTHCYDCKSPGRICESLLIHLARPYGMDAEVIIIEESYGF